MRSLRTLLLLTAASGLLVLAPARPASAQVTFGLRIGGPPACPYGYYGYSPYRCAPYGYYGPEWFNGGVFLGAGPWFHGPHRFYGHVDRRYDPRFGYHGPFPEHGRYREPDDHWHNFHGNDRGDARGHYNGHFRDDHHDDHGHGGDHGHDDHGH